MPTRPMSPIQRSVLEQIAGKWRLEMHGNFTKTAWLRWVGGSTVIRERVNLRTFETLQREGWITKMTEPLGSVRHYRITASGRKALQS